jgi:hypothetical protein
MSTSLFLKVICVASLAGVAWAEQETENTKPRLTLELLDGSRVIGVPTIRTVPVETPYAKINVPLERILSIRINEKQKTAAFELQNGDRLNGTIDLGPIELETVFGKASIATELIRSIGVASSGALPAGDGPLSFGGLNWIPWRTQFELQGDKLVSLPKVRPGFNYGHGGNGRGATILSNIGNANWKDYSMEFEFGMTGVDPAFNPHQLPAGFRSGSILFHVADTKESWNEKGSSLYSLNFAGDGSWSLICTYNGYCQTACGYGNPTSDGQRTLAEGKGLKHDPEAGNRIRIDLMGSRIQIWVDGLQIVDARDEKMRDPIGGQTLDHGGIAFTWGFESMGWVRNFSAKRL